MKRRDESGKKGMCYNTVNTHQSALITPINTLFSHDFWTFTAKETTNGTKNTITNLIHIDILVVLKLQ